jgi:hypothetical protein
MHPTSPGNPAGLEWFQPVSHNGFCQAAATAARLVLPQLAAAGRANNFYAARYWAQCRNHGGVELTPRKSA